MDEKEIDASKMTLKEYMVAHGVTEDIDWDELKKQSDKEIEESERRYEQLRQERIERNKMMSKMTHEELSDYLEERYRRVNEQAKKYFTNIKTIEIEEDEE